MTEDKELKDLASFWDELSRKDKLGFKIQGKPFVAMSDERFEQELYQIQSKAGKARWSGTTSQERSEHMRRIAKLPRKKRGVKND